MKHTKGPWKQIDDDEDYITITDEEQNFGICKLKENANESRPSMKANARLIAAAPEMLEALQMALSNIPRPTMLDRNCAERLATLAHIQDVIDKAIGEKLKPLTMPQKLVLEVGPLASHLYVIPGPQGQPFYCLQSFSVETHGDRWFLSFNDSEFTTELKTKDGYGYVEGRGGVEKYCEKYALDSGMQLVIE